MPAATSRCDTCGAPILWCLSTSTDRRIPIDALPVPHGNVTLDGDPLSISGRDTLRATVHGDLDIALLLTEEPTVDLYVTHFVTCPDADQWRGGTRHSRRPRREHA